jgi:hypothetical protein
MLYQDFGFDAPHGVVYGGRGALYRCGDAENVTGSDAAIGVFETLKRKVFERGQGSRHGGRNRQLFKSRRRWGVERVFANPKPGFDGTIRVADDVSIADEGRAALEAAESNLVRLRYGLPDKEPSVVGAARLDAFCRHNDTGVVRFVDADEKGSQTAF